MSKLHPPNRLREWRKAKGLSLAALGEMIGASQVSLSRIELQKQAFHVWRMRLVAKALDIPAVQLLAWEDNPDSMTPEEWFFLQKVRSLSPEARALLEEFMEHPTLQ